MYPAVWRVELEVVGMLQNGCTLAEHGFGEVVL